MEIQVYGLNGRPGDRTAGSQGPVVLSSEPPFFLFDAVFLSPEKEYVNGFRAKYIDIPKAESVFFPGYKIAALLLTNGDHTVTCYFDRKLGHIIDDKFVTVDPRGTRTRTGLKFLSEYKEYKIVYGLAVREDQKRCHIPTLQPYTNEASSRAQAILAFLLFLPESFLTQLSDCHDLISPQDQRLIYALMQTYKNKSHLAESTVATLQEKAPASASTSQIARYVNAEFISQCHALEDMTKDEKTLLPEVVVEDVKYKRVYASILPSIVLLYKTSREYTAYVGERDA